MLNDETLKAAIHATVAKQIIEGLGTEARDALLLKSMTAALTDYTFRNAVEKVVAEEAMKVAAQVVQSDEWHRRITEAIKAGFDDYLINLRAATQRMAQEMMHGTQGVDAYSRWPGKVLGQWPKKMGPV